MAVLRSLCGRIPERVFYAVFTDCLCCAFARGLAVGALLGAALTAGIARLIA